MLYKACGGDISKWWWFLPHVLWADHISIRKHLGCLPFFMVTGAHPTLPLDVTETTGLVELPDRVLTDDELIGYRAKALAKHKTHRYLGPMVVIRCTKGRSYVIAELNGALWQQKVGAFHCVPYFARRSIKLPENVLEWTCPRKVYRKY